MPEAVIVATARSPIGRAFKGTLTTIRPDDLTAQIVRAGAARLLAYHVCDWLAPTRDLLNDRGMMGDGVIELEKCRRWMEDAGYSGYSEVEIFSNHWWSKPGEEVLATCIARHKSVV